MTLMYATNQRAAANALREIARRLEASTDPDTILDSLCDVEPFTKPDINGVLHCTVCDEEAHNADCPVRTLEELWGILAHDKIVPDPSVRLAW